MMYEQDEESQIFYWPKDPQEIRRLTNKERFAIQREAMWHMINGEKKSLASQKVNKRIPRQINITQELQKIGVKDPDAWIKNYKKSKR